MKIIITIILIVLLLFFLILLYKYFINRSIFKYSGGGGNDEKYYVPIKTIVTDPLCIHFISAYKTRYNQIGTFLCLLTLTKLFKIPIFDEQTFKKVVKSTEENLFENRINEELKKVNDKINIIENIFGISNFIKIFNLIFKDKLNDSNVKNIKPIKKNFIDYYTKKIDELKDLYIPYDKFPQKVKNHIYVVTEYLIEEYKKIKDVYKEIYKVELSSKKDLIEKISSIIDDSATTNIDTIYKNVCVNILDKFKEYEIIDKKNYDKNLNYFFNNFKTKNKFSNDETKISQMQCKTGEFYYLLLKSYQRELEYSFITADEYEKICTSDIEIDYTTLYFENAIDVYYKDSNRNRFLKSAYSHSLTLYYNGHYYKGINIRNEEDKKKNNWIVIKLQCQSYNHFLYLYVVTVLQDGHDTYGKHGESVIKSNKSDKSGLKYLDTLYYYRNSNR